MACDPNTLLDNARCIESCLTYGQMDAIEVNLLCIIAGGGPSPPGETFYILFENGDRWLTEDGLNLIRKE
jgi:hypothetical protein